MANKWSAGAAKAVKAVLRIKNGWSFSRYSVYKQCPAKARYKFIDKLPEPAAKPLDRGSLIHKQAENYIKGLPCPIVDDETETYPRLDKDGSMPAGMKTHETGVMPPQLGKFSHLFGVAKARFKKKIPAAIVEGTWAFTKGWVLCSPTDWDNCWLRINVDYAHEETGATLYIEDWKTGKFDERQNAEYLETLQLYALGGLLALTHIKKVRPSLVYLDRGVVHPDPLAEPLEYTRADIPKLKKIWEGRVAPMFTDTQFVPRPNSKCNWCAYAKVKGGPCKF